MDFKGTKKSWNKFPKPALITASPCTGMVVAGKTKTAEIGRATGNFLKSKSGGNLLSLRDFHGNGLRLEDM